MLSVENLHYSIGRKKIIDGISINFEPGIFYVIVGPNGSGKSTFLKVFSGESKPDSGIVLYNGKDIFAIPKNQVAQKRAVMSQQPELHFPLTVSEIVMMGRYPHFIYKPSKKDENICHAAMRKMEMENFAQRDYLTLSGGEKQRVQFARVLAQVWEAPAEGNRYLFLDEPIASLDIHYQHNFLKIVKALVLENFVLIAVLHDINLAVQYADRIIFMKEGKIVKHGLSGAVVSSDLIKDVFDISVNVINNPIHNTPLVIF